MSFAMCCEKIQRRPVRVLRGTRQNRNEVANATSEIVWLGRSGVLRTLPPELIIGFLTRTGRPLIAHISWS